MVCCEGAQIPMDGPVLTSKVLLVIFEIEFLVLIKSFKSHWVSTKPFKPMITKQLPMAHQNLQPHCDLSQKSQKW